MAIKLSKSQICQEKVAYCGWEIDHTGFRPKYEYLIELDSVASPHSRKAVAGCHGCASHPAASP